MHVGLNLVFCVPGETGGMETAARGLIPQLGRQPGLRLTAFVNREGAGSFAGVDEVVVPVHATNRLEWVRGEQQHLPRLAARAGCDLVHSLGSTAPLRGPFRRVTTIHDLNYRMVPESHFGLRSLGMRVLVPAAARRSHRLLADSTSTRDDLVAHVGVPIDKVDVVPLGVALDRDVTPTPEPDLRARLELGERPLLLCVGAKRPHKNAGVVLEAMVAMKPAPVLVVTGYRSPYEAELRAQADALRQQLRLPGYLSAPDLEGLYAAATCVVVPSLYEGFGLPVIEAMARGAPVVCSDRSSLPEVAGDAALQFDPHDPAQLCACLERVMAGEGDRLRAAGFRQAARFTWERTARLTAAAYRRASRP